MSIVASRQIRPAVVLKPLFTPTIRDRDCFTKCATQFGQAVAPDESNTSLFTLRDPAQYMSACQAGDKAKCQCRGLQILLNDQDKEAIKICMSSKATCGAEQDQKKGRENLEKYEEELRQCEAKGTLEPSKTTTEDADATVATYVPKNSDFVEVKTLPKASKGDFAAAVMPQDWQEDDDEEEDDISAAVMPQDWADEAGQDALDASEDTYLDESDVEAYLTKRSDSEKLSAADAAVVNRLHGRSDIGDAFKELGKSLENAASKVADVAKDSASEIKKAVDEGRRSAAPRSMNNMGRLGLALSGAVVVAGLFGF